MDKKSGKRISGTLLPTIILNRPGMSLKALYLQDTHTHMKQTFHLKIIKKNINNSSNIIIIIINIYQMTKDKRV